MKLALDVSNEPDLRAAAATAARMRADGLTTSVRVLDPRGLSHTGRREVRALLARQALAGAALRADLPAKGLAADADGDRIISTLEEAMIAARDCGFAVVACDLGRLPRTEHDTPPRRRIDPAAAGDILLPEPVDVEPPPPPPPLSEPERRHAAFAVEVMRALGSRADRVGVPMAFSASLASQADLEGLLSAAGCPCFGRELDPVALLEAGPAGAVGVEPPVMHVRGRDASAGPEGRHRAAALGEGDADWRELLGALREADYRGFISVEGPAREARAALERLRALLS